VVDWLSGWPEQCVAAQAADLGQKLGASEVARLGLGGFWGLGLAMCRAAWRALEAPWVREIELRDPDGNRLRVGTPAT
jgi:hypothetical protein